MADRNTSAATALLPCPFCGSTPRTGWQGHRDEGYYAVECPTCSGCGMDKPSRFIGVHADDDDGSAEAAWNERAAQPGALGEAQQVNAALLQALRNLRAAQNRLDKAKRGFDDAEAHEACVALARAEAAADAAVAATGSAS